MYGALVYTHDYHPVPFKHSQDPRLGNGSLQQEGVVGGLYDSAKFILLFQKMLCLFGLLGLLVTDNPFVHIHIAYVGHKITSKEIKTDLLSIYFKQDFLTTWTL